MRIGASFIGSPSSGCVPSLPIVCRGEHRPIRRSFARTPQPTAASSDAAPAEDVDAVRMHRNSHEARHGARKLRELEHVADVGESAETPLILIGEVWFVVAIAVLVVLAHALVAYRLAA